MAKRLKRGTSKAINLVHVVLIIAAILAVITFILSQTKYLNITDIKLSSDTIPRQYSGYKIAHISDLDNENTGVVQKTSKSKPDLILVSGGLVDKNGNCQNSIKTLNSLSNIAPTYFVLQPEEIEYESDIVQNTSATYLNNSSITLPAREMTVERYINENCDKGIIKEVKKNTEDAQEYVKYIQEQLDKDEAKTIQICGLNGAESNIYDTLDKLYELEKKEKAYNRILLLGNNKVADQFKDSGVNTVLTGNTYGIKENNKYYKDANTVYNYTLLVSRGACSNIPNNKRFMNFREIQMITLSDGQVYKRNPLERFIEIFVKDTGTIFDNDGGFNKTVTEYKNTDYK